MKIEVLFTPAEFATLKGRVLANTACVVFDVLRATSSMVTALANGATGVIPVEEIDEALALRKANPELLLAGEREGVRIQVAGATFQLGNSPREFTSKAVAGRTIAMTTTNGTRALRACIHARTVLVSCFLNLGATAEWIRRRSPASLLIVCSGTHEEAAYEDVLGAGALCEQIRDMCNGGSVADSALLARKLWTQEQTDVLRGISQSRNGQRLLSMPELREDVSFCSQRDLFPLVAKLGADGVVRKK